MAAMEQWSKLGSFFVGKIDLKTKFSRQGYLPCITSCIYYHVSGTC